MGLKSNKFASTAKMIVSQLREKGEWKDASTLEDIAPLFDPHEFWDNQPVPKLKDSVVLPDDDYDQAIETKTVDQVP